MTRGRLAILVTGVLALAALFVLRVVRPGPPEDPSFGAPGAVLEDEKSSSLSNRPDVDDAIAAFSGRTMGTTYSIKYVPRGGSVSEVVQAKVEAALLDVNETMSTYDPKSELSLLNATTKGIVVKISEPLMAVLTLSEKVHRTTDGAFDVTVGPLVRAYGFGARGLGAIPDEAELARLRSLVGMEHVKLDQQSGTVQKDADGVDIDLSAVAKGYGVDRVAQTLEELGMKEYMVEVGGEVRTLGAKPSGRKWRLAIEYPDPASRRVYMTVDMDQGGMALATSGDYRNFRKVDGTVVSHTMDPRLGQPVPRRTASVSVMRPTAAEADALATALCVLEPEESISLADDMGWAVLLLVHEDNDEIRPLPSRAFSDRYELPP